MLKYEIYIFDVSFTEDKKTFSNMSKKKSFTDIYKALDMFNEIKISKSLGKCLVQVLFDGKEIIEETIIGIDYFGCPIKPKDQLKEYTFLK